MYSDLTDAQLLHIARGLTAEISRLATMSRRMRRCADDYTAEMREQGEALVEEAAARGLAEVESLAARALSDLEALLA